MNKPIDFSLYLQQKRAVGADRDRETDNESPSSDLSENELVSHDDISSSFI